MAVSVASLREGLLAVLALERHTVLMDSDMVSEIAEFWKLQRAVLALKDLVHTLGLWVVLVDNLVIALVHDFTLTQHVVFGLADAFGPHVDVEVHGLLLLDLVLSHHIILVVAVDGLFLVLSGNIWVRIYRHHWIELLVFLLALLQLHQNLLRGEVHSLVLGADHAHRVSLAFDFMKDF